MNMNTLPEPVTRFLGLAAEGEDAPENSSRREFIQKGAGITAWGAMFLGAGAALYETVRFFYPTVVFHPPSVFRIGRIADFVSDGQPDAHGVILVDDRFKQDLRFFVVREAHRVYALFARCTHLGCTVNWFSGLNVFKCPCHGSEFHSNGKEFAGPAPRPLDRLHISQDADGDILVDTRMVFTEREFERQRIYIDVT